MSSPEPRPVPRHAPARLTDEQRQLAADHLTVALDAAIPFQEAYPALADDLASAAMFGLVQAALKFEEARGLRFWIWVRIIVRRRLIDVTRQHRAEDRLRKSGGERGVLADRLRARGDALGLFGLGCRSEKESPSAQVDEEDFFAWATAELDDDGRQLLDLLYRRGMTRVEAGARLGRSEWAAKRLKANCLAALAGRLKPDCEPED